MATIKRLEDVKAWQSARAFARAVYLLPKEHPVNRDFGFRDQLRRAAVSIMCNVAEAYGRSSDADKSRVLDYARGSGNESLSLLILGNDIEYFAEDEFERLEAMNRTSIAQVSSWIGYLRRNGRVQAESDANASTVNQDTASDLPT